MYTFRLDEINNTANFTFPYNLELKERIKNSGRDVRYNIELKEWVIPVNDWTKGEILSIIKEYGFRSKELEEKESEFSYTQTPIDYAYLKGMCAAKGFEYDPRDYQLEALGYALEKQSIINGDDVGLGKTFESIIYAETTNSFPCLVIVPASVKDQWKKEWIKITKEKRSVSVINSTPTKKKPNNWSADVIIINYDIIGKKAGTGATSRFDELVKIPWKMAICDEAHFLKEKKSMRSKAAKKILKSDKMLIQMLTGTAIMSKPVEIWNLLVLLGKSEDIAKDWFQFTRRYCGAYKGSFGWVTDGATNMLELNQKLRNSCYIRREKRDVLTELPPVTKQVIQVPITNRNEINKALDNFIEYIKETKGEESADKAMEAEHLVAIGVLRRLAVAGKCKGIEQYLKDWKPSGKKLVVFGIHNEQLKYLSEKFKCPLIDGGISSPKKEEIKTDWINSDDVFLFANMEAAGTGVDGLQTVCSNMTIIELPWRTSDLTQVIGRIDRSGQKEPSTITFLLNNDTIDNEMWSMLENKEIVTEAVNKGIDVRGRKTGMKFIIQKIMKK